MHQREIDAIEQVVKMVDNQKPREYRSQEERNYLYDLESIKKYFIQQNKKYLNYIKST